MPLYVAPRVLGARAPKLVFLQSLYDLCLASVLVCASDWAISTMTTVGYGDIVPHSDIGRVFCIVAMVIGGTFYGFIIASMSSIVAAVDANARQHSEKMDMINSYMAHHRFPPELKSKMRVHFKKCFEMRTALDEQAILNDLDPKLQQEVGIFLLNDVVHSNPVFKMLPKAMLTRVMLILRPMIVAPAQYVMQEHEQGSEMYMVISGELDLTREEGTVQVLREGASMGELTALGVESTYEATVSASEPSELYLMTHTDIVSTFEASADILQNMRDQAVEIMEKRRDDWQTGRYATEVGGAHQSNTLNSDGNGEDDEETAPYGTGTQRAKKRSSLFGSGYKTLPDGFADMVRLSV